jgi:trk system potassium uptake protein TrkA
MNILVIGCGRVGAQLAHRLFQKGNKVTVVDQNPGAFANLPSDFLGRTIEGEATHLDVLLRAGIETANGVAIVTNSDATNAVIGHAIRSKFDLHNIVVRNFDPAWRSVLEVFGHQIISSTAWGAQRIEEMLYDTEMRAVFSAGNGEVEIYEFEIPKLCDGHILADLVPEIDCVLVGLTRNGKAVIADQKMVLAAGDIVTVGATFEGINALRSKLKVIQEA